MKKVLLALLALICTTLTAAPKLNFSDRFAFAGLESAKLVPPSGSEILERKVPVRNMDQRPIKDAVYVYHIDVKDAITVDQLNSYVAQVFAACKAAANDGKVYIEPSYGDTKLTSEMTEPKVFKKPSGTLRCVFKHGDKWFSVKAGYGTEYGGDVWVKDLPEKFYCWIIYVKEYFIDEL